MREEPDAFPGMVIQMIAVGEQMLKRDLMAGAALDGDSNEEVTLRYTGATPLTTALGIGGVSLVLAGVDDNIRSPDGTNNDTDTDGDYWLGSGTSFASPASAQQNAGTHCSTAASVGARRTSFRAASGRTRDYRPAGRPTRADAAYLVYVGIRTLATRPTAIDTTRSSPSTSIASTSRSTRTPPS